MKITNKFNLPETFVQALKNDDYDLDPQPHRYSATQLINPYQITILTKRYEGQIEQDVSDMLWMLYGKGVHYILERGEDKDALQEERLDVELLERTISGKSDIYKDGKVSDYKFTSVWSIVYGSRILDWERQLNIYAYLFREHGFEVTDLEVVAMFRDWSRTKAENDSSYPSTPVEVVKLKLWSKEEQRAYIEQRIAGLRHNEEMPDDQLAPCTEEEVWAKPTTYAVMKRGRKSALRVLESYDDALQYMRDTGKGDYIDTRQGEWTRCKTYCPVASFCSQNPYRGEI